MSNREFQFMTEALRHCIAEDDTSFTRLGEETGVLRQTLVKFASGEQGLQTWAADLLCEHYELRVVLPPKRKDRG